MIAKAGKGKDKIVKKVKNNDSNVISKEGTDM